MAVHAAVDLGASGGRVMAGMVDGDSVRLEEVHRFPNGCAERDGHLRWDLSGLFAEVQAGLAKVPEAETVGIDTWGVDYGLLDEDGGLLAEPIAYRDGRTDTAVDRVHAVVAPDELFAANGLQLLPFTTIYQLAAEELLGRAAHAVLIPDLLAHWLTGELATEVTNASTTGLLDVHTREWSAPLFDRLGLAADLFPPLQSPGERRGGNVVTVGSHDTASAVVGVPATTERFAYVACGTWSLVGLELPAPVVTDEARAANFTNEAGVDGRTRFLRNVGGLWLLQECLREWGRHDLTALLEQAAALPPGPQVDVDDPAFIPPGGMPQRIAAAAGRPLDPVETTRCNVDTLATAFARTVEQAATLAGTDVDVVHVVGGGSQNDLLCRLTAEAVGRPVLAGPVEATALGNVLVQARRPGDSLEALRSRLAAAVPLRRYDP
jgi:rhamnulokinase